MQTRRCSSYIILNSLTAVNHISSIYKWELELSKLNGNVLKSIAYVIAITAVMTSSSSLLVLSLINLMTAIKWKKPSPTPVSGLPNPCRVYHFFSCCSGNTGELGDHTTHQVQWNWGILFLRENERTYMLETLQQPLAICVDLNGNRTGEDSDDSLSLTALLPPVNLCLP